jgi:hypothetical protein
MSRDGMAVKVAMARARQLESYRRNSDIILGWERVASKSMRTCLYCLLMDGEQYPLHVEFEDLNRCSSEYCRCTVIAVLDGVPRPRRTLGRRWFLGLTTDKKEKILGAERFQKYQAGVPLWDLVN